MSLSNSGHSVGARCNIVQCIVTEWRRLVARKRLGSLVTPFLCAVFGRLFFISSIRSMQCNRVVANSNSADGHSKGRLSTAADSDDRACRAMGTFRPRKVLILSKMTRLDFERRRQDISNEDEADTLNGDANFQNLHKQHNAHYSYLKRLCHELSVRNVECKVVQRWDYNPELINWADAVFSAGGDGTYLLAASKIREPEKPLIGINTDPTCSEGYLCLMKKRSEDHLSDALDRLFAGDFRWTRRQRIRVTLTGKNLTVEPLELYNQHLMYPEYRWSEHVREHEDVRLQNHSAMSRLSSATSVGSSQDKDATCNERTLPYLALNDVFIGESLSSRVSYYDLQVDNGDYVKQKSSGVTVCTGTGSTSWYFNINKLTDICVRDLLTIISDEVGINLPASNSELVSKICKRFNEKLVFSPEDIRMAYAVRDPVFNATFPPFPPRGFSQKVVIRSNGFDSHLVIDGGVSYMFANGTTATLEINPDDALRTIVFR